MNNNSSDFILAIIGGSVFGIIGLYITFMNWLMVYRYYKYKETSSTAPLFGGLFLSFSIVFIVPVTPLKDTSNTFYWFLTLLPFVIDRGCLLLLIRLLIFLGGELYRKVTKRDEKVDKYDEDKDDVALYDKAKAEDDGYRISSEDLRAKYGL